MICDQKYASFSSHFPSFFRIFRGKFEKLLKETFPSKDSKRIHLWISLDPSRSLFSYIWFRFWDTYFRPSGIVRPFLVLQSLFNPLYRHFSQYRWNSLLATLRFLLWTSDSVKVFVQLRLLFQAAFQAHFRHFRTSGFNMCTVGWF